MVDQNMPLTEYEKWLLLQAGWAFLNENYIYIPDDYDGCMAYGIKEIRRVLESVKKQFGISDQN